MNYKLGIITFFLFMTYSVFAQNSEYKMKGNEKEITIDFLSSYYEQDGNNAAVTGGVGTEKLTDFVNVLVVNIPFDTINSVSITGGADYYSSASTDNIDSEQSSASSHDLRTYGTVSYSRKNLRKGETYIAKINASSEYDYKSISFGLAYAKEFNEGNSEISLNAQMFRDDWELFIPSELRSTTNIPSTTRNSYNFQATFSQVINQRMQFSISGEAIYMEGLLSTPFHRVYFQEQTLAKVENLPDTRLKIPIGLRLNYFPTDLFVVRSYYRFYFDDWGLKAHTLNLEIPVKVTDWLTLSPYYRYHTQNAVDYFAPFAQHTLTEQFYTSDYDLSELNSSKIGMGIKISPLYGLARLKWGKGKIFQFKSLELRTAYYKRSTDLTAFIGSVNLSFGIK